MPEPHPGDIVGQAADALGAVCDLLVSVTRHDLHQVDPGGLYALLALVRERLEAAEAILNRPPQHL